MLANNAAPSNINISKAMIFSNRCYKNKLYEIRDAQNEEIKYCKRKQLLQQIDGITKKKSLPFTSTKNISNFYFAYVKFFKRASQTETQGIKWLI